MRISGSVERAREGASRRRNGAQDVAGEIAPRHNTLPVAPLSSKPEHLSFTSSSDYESCHQSEWLPSSHCCYQSSPSLSFGSGITSLDQYHYDYSPSYSSIPSPPSPSPPPPFQQSPYQKRLEDLLNTADYTNDLPPLTPSQKLLPPLPSRYLPTPETPSAPPKAKFSNRRRSCPAEIAHTSRPTPYDRRGSQSVVAASLLLTLADPPPAHVRPKRASRAKGANIDKPLSEDQEQEARALLDSLPARDADDLLVGKKYGKKKDADYIPRPRNSFILYRSWRIQQYRTPENETTSVSHGLLNGVKNPKKMSEIIGDVWRRLPQSEKDKWARVAKLEKARHKEEHPDYTFVPGGLREKKGKKSESDEDFLEVDEADVVWFEQEVVASTEEGQEGCQKEFQQIVLAATVDSRSPEGSPDVCASNSNLEDNFAPLFTTPPSAIDLTPPFQSHLPNFFDIILNPVEEVPLPLDDYFSSEPQAPPQHPNGLRKDSCNPTLSTPYGPVISPDLDKQGFRSSTSPPPLEGRGGKSWGLFDSGVDSVFRR